MAGGNSRTGMILFVFYALIYGGFVLTNAFWPAAMEATPVGGVSLAVSSGIGLILLAMLVSVAYGFLSRHRTSPAGPSAGRQE